MDESGAADRDADPAVVVEVTPRDLRWRGYVFVVVGLLLTAVSVWPDLGDHRHLGDPFFGLATIGYGIYCLVQARHRVTRGVPRIDGSGIRSGDGLHDQAWTGVVMVWVGSSTG